MTRPRRFLEIHFRDPVSCPHCGEPHKIAAPAPFQPPVTRAPQQGDVTVCIKCAMPATFNEERVLRALTDAEERALGPVVRVAMLMIAASNRSKGGPQA